MGGRGHLGRVLRMRATKQENGRKGPIGILHVMVLRMEPQNDLRILIGRAIYLVLWAFDNNR